MSWPGETIVSPNNQQSKTKILYYKREKKYSQKQKKPNQKLKKTNDLEKSRLRRFNTSARKVKWDQIRYKKKKTETKSIRMDSFSFGAHVWERKDKISLVT